MSTRPSPPAPSASSPTPRRPSIISSSTSPTSPSSKSSTAAARSPRPPPHSSAIPSASSPPPASLAPTAKPRRRFSPKRCSTPPRARRFCRHHRISRCRRSAPLAAHHARVARSFRTDGRRREPRRHRTRHRSLEPRPRPGPRIRHSIRCGRLHQPHARPSRLPPDDGEILRRQAPALRRHRVSRAARRRHQCARRADARTRSSRTRSAGAEVRTYGIGLGEWRAASHTLTPGGAVIELETPAGSAQSPRISPAKSTSSTCSPPSPLPMPAAFLSISSSHPFRVLQPVPGRFQPVDAGQPFTVIVDYAHTDDALRNLTALARQMIAQSGGRVITLFGCGGDRDRTKRPKMGQAAGEGSDFVVATSDNPRSEDPRAILAEIEPGLKASGVRYTIEPDRAAAIRLALGSPSPATWSSSPAKATRKSRSSPTAPFLSTTRKLHSPRCANWVMVESDEAHSCRSGHRRRRGARSARQHCQARARSWHRLLHRLAHRGAGRLFLRCAVSASTATTSSLLPLSAAPSPPSSRAPKSPPCPTPRSPFRC